MSRRMSRRDALRSAVATATAIGALASGASLARGETPADPIIALCAEALRLAIAANAACSVYAQACDAANDAGYPDCKPGPVRHEPTANEDEAAMCAVLTDLQRERLLRLGWARRLREISPLAEADRVARKERERVETEALIMKWQEGDRLFRISASVAAMERAGNLQIDARQAVLDAPITSPAGALAVFAVGHWYAADGDNERAEPLFEKARAYVDLAGILGPDFPAFGHPTKRQGPEGGDA